MDGTAEGDFSGAWRDFLLLAFFVVAEFFVGGSTSILISPCRWVRGLGGRSRSLTKRTLALNKLAFLYFFFPSVCTTVHLNKHSLILVSQPYQLLSMPKKDKTISEDRETFLRVPTLFSLATPEFQAIPTVRLGCMTATRSTRTGRSFAHKTHAWAENGCSPPQRAQAIICA
jgi:hypothetical protein